MLMSKIQAVVARSNNTILKEKTYYDVLSKQRKNGNGAKNTRKKRHLQINKKERKKETRVAIGTPAYRRTNERRAAASTKKHKDENEAKQNKRDENEAKQNKRNTRERRHGICNSNARRIKDRATCG